MSPIPQVLPLSLLLVASCSAGTERGYDQALSCFAKASIADRLGGGNIRVASDKTIRSVLSGSLAAVNEAGRRRGETPGWIGSDISAALESETDELGQASPARRASFARSEAAFVAKNCI